LLAGGGYAALIAWTSLSPGAPVDDGECGAMAVVFIPVLIVLIGLGIVGIGMMVGTIAGLSIAGTCATVAHIRHAGANNETGAAG
jgi:hypothetical protein